MGVAGTAGERAEGRQGLARLVQEVCAKAGDLFECAYYGPGEPPHAEEPRVVLKRRTLSRPDALRAMCAPVPL